MNVEWWGGSQARLLPSTTRRSAQLGDLPRASFAAGVGLFAGRLGAGGLTFYTAGGAPVVTGGAVLANLFKRSVFIYVHLWLNDALV